MRTDQAVAGLLRQVEMRLRRTSNGVAPGVPTARSPDRGRPIGTPVHLEHDARGAKRLSTEPLHTVRFEARAPAEDNTTAETRPELSGAESRNPEQRPDESGASARSESGAMVNGRPESARQRPRLMTSEERDAHVKQRRTAKSSTQAAKRLLQRRAARQLELNQQSHGVAQPESALGASSAADSSELPGELRA